MRKLIFAAALAALSACSGHPQQRPRLAVKGLPAPEITLPKLINAPIQELRSWDELKNKVVVLEFWATWCEDCSDSLPRLNALAERFKGKPVVFLYITDESRSDVEGFLAHNRIEGWVAPEAGAEVFKSFKVYNRPHTVVIGRDGKVAGFYQGGPGADTVMELLAGRPSVSSPGTPAPALAEFYIARSRAGSGTAQYGPASLNASAMSLKYALEWIYGRVDSFDIKPSAASEMSAVYDIRLRLPADRSAAREKLFLEGLKAALGLKVSRQEREAEVYALKKAPGGPMNVKECREYGGARLKGAVLEVKGASFAALASRLGEVLREPVLDETASSGPYEYKFELASADPKTLDRELRRQLGLKLVKARRKISIVEVSGPGKK